MDQENKYIDPSHLPQIAQSFNDLIRRADEDRVNFLKFLITIYTPVTSGIFFLARSIQLDSTAQKVYFLAVSTTSVLIVLSCLIVFFAYFLSSTARAKLYINHVRETGKHLSKPLYGKKWHSITIKTFTFIAFMLVVINVLSVLGFIYSSI